MNASRPSEHPPVRGENVKTSDSFFEMYLIIVCLALPPFTIKVLESVESLEDAGASLASEEDEDMEGAQEVRIPTDINVEGVELIASYWWVTEPMGFCSCLCLASFLVYQ